jgi:ferrous iron transport protein B
VSNINPPHHYKIALLGNPNSGKSTVFNQLTGLRQKVGNFPGVTVDKRLGKTLLANDQWVTIIDFPGTYSLYPTSLDERIVVNTFTNPDDVNYPDAVLYVADLTQLEKHLLLLTQIHDLGIPILLALNMADAAREDKIEINAEELSRQLEMPAVKISARTGEGFNQLKEQLHDLLKASQQPKKVKPFYYFSELEKLVLRNLNDYNSNTSDYQKILLAHHYQWLNFLEPEQKNKLESAVESANMNDLKLQVHETMGRFNRIEPIVRKVQTRAENSDEHLTDKIDRIITHWLAGPFIFFGLMFLVFQAIFTFATYPMDWIESIFGFASNVVKTNFPDTWLTSLLTDGVLAGISGVAVFIPQIAILFFLISILEESGYMARAVYLFDNLMRYFGLNGRSIVGLVSGAACAIPAIMTTRTISNWKERLITILVTPLISCSARIPVYTVLIGFVVPSTIVGGIFNLQGLAFMGLYLLGIVSALFAAWVFKMILKTEETSFLLLELPVYRQPSLKNVLFNVWEKTKTFIVEAGKIIFIISIVLWFLASFGPTKDMQLAEAEVAQITSTQTLSEQETANLLASKKIEASYAGHIGKFIEPAIKPLGFDWKIGIALITSFAAREVFVGTMATIYSIGSDNDELSVREKLRQARNPETGQLVYTWVTSLSLLLFYVFAMQCMSTLAVTKRETKSWKWPIVQFTFMTSLAYLSSLFVFQVFG